MKRLAIALFVFLSPLPASTSARAASDTAYCATLSDMAMRYLTTYSRRGLPDAEVVTAVDQCERGNTAGGIPTLERKLRNSGFTLPPR